MESPKARRRPGSPGFWTALHGVLWLLTLPAIVLSPRLLSLFADFGVDLPGSAVLTLRVSRMALGLLPVYVGALALLLAIDYYALRAFFRDAYGRDLARLWSLAMAALPLGIVAFQAVSLGLVWFQIDGKLRG